MKTRILTLVGSVMLMPPHAIAADTPANPDRITLPASVVPSSYDLDVTPDSDGGGFSGIVKIDVSVSRQTRTLILNAADLEIRTFSVTTAGSATAALTGAKKDAVLDSTSQIATLNFSAPIPKGHHLLTIEYRGKIHANATGLFGLTYDTPQGPKRALFTQFENSDARRFLPCWDEPARKAAFTLAATLPAADMAVSNMPIARSETLPNGTKHVHFATTPRMSSYLLFFGAGDFERIAQTVDGVDVGIIVKRGDTSKARYALDAAARILPYYEDYFGVKFPLPKLDLVAGPGRSQFFGAMENWGAIFYFEHVLEVDPALSTEADRQAVYIEIAHEMAHQWFGDLVTMQWWDEIWLNEGFASWMAGKAAEHFHPDWQIPLQAISYKETAMELDARAGTHPVVQPIRDVLQANQAFDSITYAKGFAVVTMLESSVGEAAFRAGVREYVRKHAYGNTASDDLWAEIDKTATQPVSVIAHDFTLQAGVPLVRVVDREHVIELSQDRFAVDASGQQQTTWHVPVLERSLDTGDSWRGIVIRDHPRSLDMRSGGGVIVNASQAGYFRTLYSPALLHSLLSRFSGLQPVDQAGLLNDTHALAYSGLEPLSNFVEVARQVTPHTNATVQQLVTDELRDLDSRFDGLAGQSRFRESVRAVLNPIFAQVGWDAATADPAETKLLRASLLAALSQLGDARVVSEGRSRFARLRTNPQSFTADMRQSILAVVAESADASIWDQLHEMARHAGSFVEKEQLYGLLGTARDPELARRALQLTLGEELEVTLRPLVIKTVAQSHFPDAAFEFASAHFEQVNTWLEADSRNQFAAQLLMRSGNPAMITRLRSYAQAHIPLTARKEATVAESTIAYNVKIRSQQLPELDQWLQSAR